MSTTPRCAGWTREGTPCKQFAAKLPPGHRYCAVHSTPEDLEAAHAVRWAESVVALEWSRILAAEEQRNRSNA
jgi:hypothetical protein